FFDFRTVKRRFCVRDQGVCVRAVLRIDARTDRKTCGYIVLVDANGGVQHCEQPPAELFRRSRRVPPDETIVNSSPASRARNAPSQANASLRPISARQRSPAE